MVQFRFSCFCTETVRVWSGGGWGCISLDKQFIIKFLKKEISIYRKVCSPHSRYLCQDYSPSAESVLVTTGGGGHFTAETQLKSQNVDLSGSFLSFDLIMHQNRSTCLTPTSSFNFKCHKRLRFSLVCVTDTLRGVR